MHKNLTIRVTPTSVHLGLCMQEDNEEELQEV